MKREETVTAINKWLISNDLTDIETDNGFECPDDTNANWKFALLEKIKEKEQ